MFRVRVWSHVDYSKQLNETVVNELLEKFNEFYFGEDSRNWTDFIIAVNIHAQRSWLNVRV